VTLSPDGTKLVVGVFDSTSATPQLWSYDRAEHRWQQLTFEGDNQYPAWSPTGDRIAFQSNRDDAFNLYVMPSDASRPAERLTHSPNWQFPYSWSPDGRLLAFQEQEPRPGAQNGFDTWILPFDGDRKPWRWGPQGANVTVPMFSPDGPWIAYQSNESGPELEIYVRPFPGPEPRLRVSGAESGLWPFWSPDGRTIYYSTGDRARVMAASFDPGPPGRVSPPRLAFALPFKPPASVLHSSFRAVTPDGRRAALIRVGEQQTPPNRLVVVTNWPEVLKAKVGR
jgi:Tol biopolymer transport system component